MLQSKKIKATPKLGWEKKENDIGFHWVGDIPGLLKSKALLAGDKRNTQLSLLVGRKVQLRVGT